jgi:DNA-binding CsgD family transcriptional regulator
VNEFPSLSEEGRRRLAARGIDLEESYRAFQTAIASGEIPERLLENLAVPKTLDASEVDALELAALGLSARESADVLGVGLMSVKTRRRNARLRLGARNTTHAVALAVVLGLLFQNGR